MAQRVTRAAGGVLLPRRMSPRRPALSETRPTRFFTRLTRRAALLGGAASLAALGGRRGAAQVATPVPEASPAADVRISILFVQHAGPTTLTPGADDVHTLVMTGVIAQTLYFSDRPYHLAGTAPTATFAEKFAEVFAGSSPNAALIGHVELGSVEEEAVVVTLLSAAYDPAATTLTYEVQLLDAEQIDEPHVRGGAADGA